MNANNSIEALSNITPAALKGTPKQIAFAQKIRAAWLASQLEELAREMRIINGTASIVTAEGATDGDLVIGTDPKCETLRDAGVAMYCARADGYRASAARTSAKEWIEGSEGQWVLKHGPMARRAA